ncbi:MAG TPA: Fic family protein [Acidimicrobiales bacterium]|nr:Fic family protein [Acidimicrobiales bacterium]
MTSGSLTKGSLIDTVTVTWNGLEVEAVDPPLIAELDPLLSAATARSTERAAGAIRRFGDRSAGPAEVIARLLLRAEGLASSAIEGIRATAADVALAEATEQDHTVAAWVADNLAVVAQALSTPGPLTVEVVLAWHARLMEHATTIADRHVGAWRDVLGWVGGPNPKLAAHVAAPPKSIAGLMADLVTFANRIDLDPVTQAAIAHAQFETIHPFADGNGRIGRALIGWIVKTRLEIPVPPPVSLQIAKDIGGYLSGLTLYRDDVLEPWIRWFAGTVERSAEDSTAVMGLIGDVQMAWRDQVSDLRSDSAGRRLVDHLHDMPVLSAAMAAKALGVSDQAARLGLESLAARGVVKELRSITATTGRPTRWWAAEELLDVIGRAR